MNFNYESQINANQIYLAIFCKHCNAIFSEEWTATKAPHYGFVYRKGWRLCSFEYLSMGFWLTHNGIYTWIAQKPYKNSAIFVSKVKQEHLNTPHSSAHYQFIHNGSCLSFIPCSKR